MSKLALGRYDYAACLTFAVYAMCSMAVPMCLVPLAAELGFPLGDGGMGPGCALQTARSMAGMTEHRGETGHTMNKKRTRRERRALHYTQKEADNYSSFFSSASTAFSAGASATTAA